MSRSTINILVLAEGGFTKRAVCASASEKHVKEAIAKLYSPAYVKMYVQDFRLFNGIGSYKDGLTKQTTQMEVVTAVL